MVLAVFVGWLLRRGKRAKGTCWHNASTNNCLLLLVPQGEHFMEMAVHEGQRCEKATGKISFLDSPTKPTGSIPCLPPEELRSCSIYVLIYGDADVQNKGRLLKTKTCI